MSHSSLLTVVRDANQKVIGGIYVWELENKHKMDPLALWLHESALHAVRYLSKSPQGHLYLLVVHSETPDDIVANLKRASWVIADPMEMAVNHAQRMADFIAAGGRLEEISGGSL